MSTGSRDGHRRRSTTMQSARLIFTEAKCIDDPTLNRMGVQPFRAVSARLIHRLAATLRRDQIRTLERTGILVCRDFLPPAEFHRLQAEATEYTSLGPPTAIHQLGANRLHHWELPPADPARFPTLTQWTHHPHVTRLATAAQQRPIGHHRGTRLVEHLLIGDGHTPDEQCDLHVDTFFDTHKLWLYLDDVTPDHAPFVYAPGSHKLDRQRLRGDYRESTGANRGSRRISEEELRSRHVPVVTVTCPRNTLVLANTSGYHCRGPGAPGAVRRSLHMSYRSNPFAIRPRFRRQASTSA